MNKHFILTATGSDLPDIEAQLCNAVTQNHGQTTESNISHMAGRFAGMIQFHIPSQHTDSLKDLLKIMEKTGIHIDIEALTPFKENGHYIDISVIADNSPELFAAISRVLTEKNVLLSAIHTEILFAPYTGEPLQRIQARLFYPSETHFEAIKESLESISPELMVELLEPSKSKVMPQQYKTLEYL